MTIAIVDSYGSDTMAHDLHVFDQAFGLQPMCGEEGVTCTPGMPTFSELAFAGLARDTGTAVARTMAPAGGQERVGTRGRARRRDVARDGAEANILLVTRPTRRNARRTGLPA